VDDDWAMAKALALAEPARAWSRPNPWVGALVVSGDRWFPGVTSPPGGPHAEAAALARAGERARGATLYTTLEPCSHYGRTPPCAQAVVAAGVRRVVVGMEDPDPQVRGRGLDALRRAGVQVDRPNPLLQAQVEVQLRSYVKHRTTGRPWVVLKLAATLDGRIAAPDGSSRWITGEQARADAHRLRAASDAVLVGAGTVRADDPSLTVRLEGPEGQGRQPLRVVLGRAPEGAAVLPAVELAGEPAEVLDELGRRGVVELLVEGGATVAHALHRAGLVDRYVIYLAPVLMGGDDGRAMFAGAGAGELAGAWRGRIVSVRRLGPDLRVDLEA
jgi:diaminohydroxyphosphoribosylaminopyrimidine deaminase/5-amino-6-(5-phosphoribosylamino)uracil reductase